MFHLLRSTYLLLPISGNTGHHCSRPRPRWLLHRRDRPSTACGPAATATRTCVLFCTAAICVTVGVKVAQELQRKGERPVIVLVV